MAAAPTTPSTRSPTLDAQGHVRPPWRSISLEVAAYEATGRPDGATSKAVGQAGTGSATVAASTRGTPVATADGRHVWRPTVAGGLVGTVLGASAVPPGRPRTAPVLRGRGIEGK